MDESGEKIVYPLPYNPLKSNEKITEEDGVQFSHSYEENIQGLIDAGFTIRGIYSDINSSGHLHDLNIPSFYAIYAEKT